MSNFKRNFGAFQTEAKSNALIGTASKKLKSTTESSIKVYTRFRPVPNENFSGNKLLQSI